MQNLIGETPEVAVQKRGGSIEPPLFYRSLGVL